ncbi:MAG TPA: ribulose-phosphate 3-epimerase [Bacillota bacterium]|nr:ribulose-phosphate 3-epimerase [Bacillota bacterium]
MHPINIAPSILSANFAHLMDDIHRIENNATMLHIDVMDGHYVPNITMGVPVIQSIRKETNMIFDVHLMIESPEKLVDIFADAGSDIITFHIETSDDPDKLIEHIHQLGKRAGISIHPDTPIEKVFPYLAKIDLILIMAVRPGFGGQKFLPQSLTRVEIVRKKLDDINSKAILSVDGGVTTITAPQIICSGADVLVAGSAVFGKENPEKALEELRTCVM